MSMLLQESKGAQDEMKDRLQKFRGCVVLVDKRDVSAVTCDV
jgi:hypothetical protein